MSCLASGRLPDDVQLAKVAVIGSGILSSTAAEVLACAGVSYMFVIDSNYVEMGNLVRNTLTTADRGRRKAEAVTHLLDW